MPTSLPNHDIDAACRQSAAAFAVLSRLPPESRAQILDSIAAALDSHRDHILHTCAAETALTLEELAPEFARTTATLQMFAALIRNGSWCRASLDLKREPCAQAQAHPSLPTTPPHHPHPSAPNPSAPLPPSPLPSARAPGSPTHLIGPNHDLRSLLIPLGPVAVFGSSNFPLAYGVCGGDTASALAAGCSVIIKEHPAHPITGRLLATIAQAAINLATNEPRASASGNTSSDALQHVLQYIPNEDPKDFSIAQQLVQNSRVTAVGFTGSTRAGFALQTLCNSRPGPIPIFAEMGSLNCVFICPDAFARRADAIADELAASAMARIGQQCTKPGVVFVLGESELRTLNHMIRDRLLAAIPRRMLSRTVADNYYRRLDETAAEGSLESTPLPTPAQRRAALGVPVIFSSNDLWNETRRGVWEEIFGPAMIIARYNTTDSPFLLGALTLSIYAESEDIDAPFEGRGKWRSDSLREFLNTIRARAGRIIFNTPPTGVRVATSMVHGGPFPATNRPDTTAVGPRAIERWCRPICYQNCPDILLPPELQNANPRHLHRTINGEPTAAPIP